jgi:hypothetical protein
MFGTTDLTLGLSPTLFSNNIQSSPPTENVRRLSSPRRAAQVASDGITAMRLQNQRAPNASTTYSPSFTQKLGIIGMRC